MYGLLTKFVRSRWLDIGQVLFCVFMDRDEVEVHKHAKKNLFFFCEFMDRVYELVLFLRVYGPIRF